ncbi:MAG: Ldh family oxidoreductase, partial [Pseudomonadota bacterium]
MVKLTAEQIKAVTERILCAAGATEDESRQVGIRLANANLVGHDSHGLIRVCQYADQLRDKTIKSGVELTEVARNGAIAIFDANLGFGQVAAEKTTREGIKIAGETGVAVIGLRNVSHVGRVGDWAEMAAQAGMISFHYVNSPAKPGVTPFGGIERRMATN